MNTSYANDARNRGKVADEGVVLHPDDAAALGLSDGSLVRLANTQGEIVMPLHVAARTPRGVALAVKGAWPKLSPQRRNINALHAPRKTDMGESTSVHAIEVTVSAAS